jgi:hypothetical protein
MNDRKENELTEDVTLKSDHKNSKSKRIFTLDNLFLLSKGQRPGS